jgi:hypothetical protein
MKKEVVACDFEFGRFATQQQCQTFASMNCTFCGKDFCLTHTAGEFRVSIATNSRMSEQTPPAAAAPFFSILVKDRAVPICRVCGEKIYSLNVLQNAGDILAHFLTEGIEAVKAAFAAHALIAKRMDPR